MRKPGFITLILLGATCGIVYFLSCGGGGSGSRVLEGDITFNIGNNGKNIPLEAEVTWSRAFSVNYGVSGFGGPFTSLSLNLQDNLPDIDFTTLSLIAGHSGQSVALATTTGQMWMYVGRLEEHSTVCDSGEAYGPFDITLDVSSQPSSVTPATAVATPATMDIINIGAYSVCVKVVSPVNATVDLNSVGFNIAQCDDPPADISGTWAGLFSCESDCGFSGTDLDVELVITQDPDDPSQATYTDFYANYEGTVCGNRFSFSGGSVNSSESGTFIMDPGGTTATKTSTYRNYSDLCTGECSDVLSRVP